MHLFDIDIKDGQKFRESETFSKGNDITLFDTEFGRIGLCICFDMRFPEISRIMTLDGAKMIIVPAAFNMTTGPMHWETMFRQRAVDDQVFTAGVAPARDEKGAYVSYAHSILCSPWGKVIARAGAGPEIISETIDFEELTNARLQLPLLYARRQDVYSVGRIEDGSS
jgi:predicted amidohydrolase